MEGISEKDIMFSRFRIPITNAPHERHLDLARLYAIKQDGLVGSNAVFSINGMALLNPI